MSNIPHHSDTRAKALEYLSIGISPTQAAKALGVTDAVLSKLMDEPEFVQELADRKFARTHKATTQDDALDSLESQITKQLAQSVGTIYDPMKLGRLLQQVSAVKRRGGPVTNGDNTPTKVIELHMPVAIMSRFVLNEHNQVIAAGGQDLVTIQSSQVSNLADAAIAASSKEKNNGTKPTQSTIESTINNSGGRESSGSSSTSDQKLSLPAPGQSNALEHRIVATKTDAFGFEYENQKL